MITEEQYTEKTCLFYASDYHLEMILLPYIKNKINENKIIIFTEKNLEESIDVLLTKVNLSENDKDKIRNLNWKNTDEIEFDLFKEDDEVESELLKGETDEINLENNWKNTIIIINGSFEYIKNVKSKINKFIGKYVEIVECFHVGDTDVDISDLSQKYENILNTQKI